jgi:hypothetical protein
MGLVMLLASKALACSLRAKHRSNGRPLHPGGALHQSTGGCAHFGHVATSRCTWGTMPSRCSAPWWRSPTSTRWYAPSLAPHPPFRPRPDTNLVFSFLHTKQVPLCSAFILILRPRQDLSGNRVKSLEGVEGLAALEELWMSYNEMATFDDLNPLTRLRNLRCVYLEHNPVYKEFEYRKRVAALLPELVQLDATMIPFRGGGK